MSKIRLYWYKKSGVKFGNFGDELGPYIVAKLSGFKIERVPIPRVGLFLVATYVKNLCAGRMGLSMLPQIARSLVLRGKYITSVGSIIGWSSGPRIVWGSGILFYNEKISNGKFLAVRGKYTQNRLRSLGYDAPDVLGDPALLLPLIYRPNAAKKIRLGIIPHHTQYDYLNSLGSSRGDCVVINLLDDIETIVDTISACELVASTSLHGLIVAHAYGVPAIWFNFENIKWHGSDVKFYDYFSSVGIEEYVPHPLPISSRIDAKATIDIVEQNMRYARIGVNLAVLQKKLLDVAPFKLNKRDIHWC